MSHAIALVHAIEGYQANILPISLTSDPKSFCESKEVMYVQCGKSSDADILEFANTTDDIDRGDVIMMSK